MIMKTAQKRNKIADILKTDSVLHVDAGLMISVYL